VNEVARTHHASRNRLQLVELPGGIWRVDGMVSTSCF
jgi:hypothetical protein